MKENGDMFTMIGALFISGTIGLGFWILKTAFSRAVYQLDQSIGRAEKAIEKINDKIEEIQKHTNDKFATKEDVRRIEAENHENHKRIFEKIDKANEGISRLEGMVTK